MTYNEIHPVMRTALGTFEMLRHFGFESKDIYFHQNTNEPTNPLEPRGWRATDMGRMEAARD